jgi:hypothetical protein
MTGERQPSQQALLQGAIRTLEEVLTPELRSTWARSSALGLVGQLRYALARLERNSLAEQDAELESCLSAVLGEFPELREVASAGGVTGDASWDLREQAGRLLVFALDLDTPAAAALRERLRPLLTAHTAQDLAESGPMLQAFLASGSLGSTG